MAKASFRFSTEILRRLGEELNPSPDQGIIELVKNAYDANAKKCTITLENINNVGGRVIITDDGDGMKLKDIKDGWLVLGQSLKDNSKRTRLGRKPAGNKGLGRLAALRMGGGVDLVTRPRLDSKTYNVHIDWNKFNKKKIVEDVELNIKTNIKKKESKGTTITIDKLGKQIGRMDVKRLARSLILLADPFGINPDGFQPKLEVQEYKDLEKLVSQRYLEEADFHLIANVGKNGKVKAKVTDWKGKILFKCGHEEVAGKKRKKYICPVAQFDLWIFIKNKESFSLKTISISQVTEWLDQFGGIHLYDNGLRVEPYGNPGNDWLDMNLQRARSPEGRPSTNTSIGKVYISGDDIELTQKTDRSGYIETDSFKELRKFCQDSLNWLAKERLRVDEISRKRNRTNAQKKSSKQKKNVEDAVRGTSKQKQEEILDAVDKLEKSKNKEIKTLKKEVQLYRTLSTAGITAATFAHESRGNPIKVITHSIRAIERRAKLNIKNKYKKLFEKPVNSIVKSTESLAVLGSATLRLVDQEKRRVGRVDINNVITGVLDTMKPFIEGRDVKIYTNMSVGNPYLIGTQAAVESIITNLINNSLNAFERAGTTNRKIKVETKIADEELVIIVTDNGPGIKDLSIKDVWLPGVSSEANGTGLGLAIVHDAVVDLSGDVKTLENGKFGGAEFNIILPIVGM